MANPTWFIAKLDSPKISVFPILLLHNKKAV